MDYQVMWQALRDGLEKRTEDHGTPVYDRLTIKGIVRLMDDCERFNSKPLKPNQNPTILDIFWKKAARQPIGRMVSWISTL